MQLEVHKIHDCYVIFAPSRAHGNYAKGSASDIYGPHAYYGRQWEYGGMRDVWEHKAHYQIQRYTYKWIAILFAKYLEKKLIEEDRKQDDAHKRKYGPSVKVWR